MSRYLLSDETCVDPVTHSEIVLDSDICTGVQTVALSERMSVHNRVLAGRNEDGDAMYDWTAIATDVPIILTHQRMEVVDGTTIVRVRITSLLLDQTVNERSAIKLDLGDAADPMETNLFRVNRVEHSGVVSYIEAERELDLD